MILLWGPRQDGALRAVANALKAIAEPFVLLDQNRAHETLIEFGSCGIPEKVRLGGESIDLNGITAAYLRPYALDACTDKQWLEADSNAQRHAVQVMGALWAWMELTQALVINRPSATASNGSKPWQAILIRRHGFLTPETLITNDPRAAQQFWAKHGSVIYKSISGQRSRVVRLSSRHASRWRVLRWCPTQFQQYIPGHDFRIHVIGQKLFACEVISSADDYRYARHSGDSLEIHACEVPIDCASRCQALAVSMGLEVAGVDLRRSIDGQWYCFEVNPSPAFTFYQDFSHQPIDHAIARLLTTAGGPPSPGHARPGRESAHQPHFAVGVD